MAANNEPLTEEQAALTMWTAWQYGTAAVAYKTALLLPDGKPMDVLRARAIDEMVQAVRDKTDQFATPFLRFQAESFIRAHLTNGQAEWCDLIDLSPNE